MAACTCPSTTRRSDDAMLTRLRKAYHEQGYAELAFQVLSLYIDDIPADDLNALCAKTYTAEVFGTGEIVPLRHLEDSLWLEALSNGPTLAFKDMAMQLLGNLFEYELGRRGEAAEHPGRHQRRHRQRGRIRHARQEGRARVHDQPARPHEPLPAGADVQPAGREHPQHRHRRRVRRLPGHRQGRLQRPASSSASTRSAPSTPSTGRACWRRWCTTLRATSRPPRRNDEKVSFTVPSGNFGNVCAGHVARMMGLPIAKLVVATNENDVLDEFFRTGVYRVRGSADTHETSSPSMDISKASNFERFVFDLVGRDGARDQGAVWRCAGRNRASST